MIDFWIDWLQEWEDIQAYMKTTGRGSLMRKVKQFDTLDVPPETADMSENILRPYDETTVRLSSAGAATFYVWVRFCYVKGG